jgi:PAS domain S-box-containing protein
MNKEARSQLSRYALAVGMVAVATALTQFLYFQSVRLPGLLAIILSFPVSGYLFVEPRFSWSHDVEGFGHVAVFVGVALLIWALSLKRSRAEDELRRRERELTDFLENATVGLHWVAGDGTIIWANRAELEMLGYTREEYIGRHIAEFHADEEAIQDILGRLTRGEELHNYDARLRCKDGSLRHVMINSNVLWEDGRFIHTRCFTRDVTDRKREEETRAHLAAIVESSDDAIIGQDLDGIIQSWNKGAERLYGYSPAEIAGRSVAVLIPSDMPDELPRIMERLRRGARIDQYETLRVTKDGKLLNVSLAISPVRDAAGKITGASTIARDITEFKRVQAERERGIAAVRFQAQLLDTVEQGVIATDASGAITYWNKFAEKLYGWGASEVLGRSILDITPTDATREQAAEIAARVAAGESWAGEFTVRRKDGTTFPAMVTDTPIFDEAGAVVGVVGVSVDISARKRAEQELQEQAEIIETVNRVGQSLAGELDLHKLVQTVTDAATEISDAHFGSFFYNVLDERGESYTLYTLSGVPREAFAHFPMPRNTDIFAPTFKGEGTVLIADVKQDPRYGRNSPYYGMPKGHLPVTSYLAVPVVSRSGEVYGGLFFGHPEVGIFTDRAARIIEGLAAQAAVAMDNARLFEAVQRERAKAEASEEHYRFLAESIPQIVWTTNADGSADYFNQRWYDYTGLSREDNGGFNAHDIIHPEDLRRTLELWRHSFETGERYEIELRLRRGSDESYRWHLARSIPLRDAAGKIVKWFGTSTDIDDRKRAEESQAFLAEASEVLVSSLDYEATLGGIADLIVPRLADWCSIDMVTDERTLRRLAVAHQDPAKVELARELERRYPPTLNDKEGVAKVVRTGVPELLPNIPDELFVLVTHDAKQLEILRGLGLRSAMIVPLAVQGRVLGAITFVSAESGRHYNENDLAFAEDLAHRAALAVENAQLYREAQEVNRLKDEFLATLSHELRTPLTAVLGWTRLLGTGQLDEATRERALETIERNAQAQVQLIDDILDVSRIIRGKLRLNVRPVELAPVIEAAIDSVRPAAEAKGIRLQVVLDRAAGPVSGDPDRLQQIVWNLVSNAIKFTPKEGRVQVILSRANSHLEIEVIDTGQGIAPEFLPYVFDRFRQADPTTTRTHGGLGLGLAIVRHLVELHGGSVKAESSGTGEGAIFRVTLPLLAAVREARASSAQSSASASASQEVAADGNGFFGDFGCPPELNGLRVLVVEDDADSRDLLIAVLEQCRAEVVAVPSVAEAMRALEGWLPDVLISDIEMPGEDGFSLIRRLRQLPAERGGDTPAAALTAYARPEDRMRALLAGFQIHVPKPVEPAELVTVVASLAGRAIKTEK